MKMATLTHAVLAGLIAGGLAGCSGGGFHPNQQQVAQLEQQQQRISENPVEQSRPALQLNLRRPLPIVDSNLRVWTTQETAVDALGRMGEDAVPGLVHLLSHPDATVRAEATRSLSMIGPKAAAAVPALTSSLQDPSAEVRRGAARALGQIGPAAKSAIPALMHVLEEPSSPSDRKLSQPPLSAPATRRG